MAGPSPGSTLSRMTQHVILPPSIDAVRKDDSPLTFGTRRQIQSLAGQEHGRTIPLAPKSVPPYVGVQFAVLSLWTMIS
jgi:hypothetical protein